MQGGCFSLSRHEAPMPSNIPEPASNRWTCLHCFLTCKPDVALGSLLAWVVTVPTYCLLPAAVGHVPRCVLYHDWGARLAGAVGSMFQGQGGGIPATAGSQEPSSARAELLQGASHQPEARGKGGMRSAAEIRSAYGRSATRCDSCLRSHKNCLS